MPYLMWLILFTVLPQLLLCVMYGSVIWRYRNTIGWCVMGALVFSVPWDWWAINADVWNYPKATVGVWIGASPVEEIIFIIIVTTIMTSITLIMREKLKFAMK
jgi:lycopene cyclase domain-containing protein